MNHVEWGPSVRMAPIFSTTEFAKCFSAGARDAAASEPAAGSKQPHDQQQDDGADRRKDDLAHKAGADGNAEFWKQQAGDQRAEHTDDNIADDAEDCAADDLPGEPACNQADEQNNEKALIGQLHQNSPSWCTRFLRAGSEPIDNRL